MELGQQRVIHRHRIIIIKHIHHISAFFLGRPFMIKGSGFCKGPELAVVHG